MAEMNIANAQLSDMTNKIDDYQVTPRDTEGAASPKETEYTFPNASKQLGYFYEIDELANAILMKAIWNVGKGWKADSSITSDLNNIVGWGKDTFDDILFNMSVQMSIFGDAFCEIVRNEDGALINLKPLYTGIMRIIVDEKGMIKRYEQWSRVGEKDIKREFKPEEIFHLSNNRIGDQIHGLSDIDRVEEIIKADKESFKDIKQQMHSQVRPMILWKLKTDDDTKIGEFVGKIDKARNLGEDMFIPDDENIVEHEVVQIDLSQIVLAWRTEVRNKFYRAMGLPLIVFGNAGTTESGGKIEYLAHEQIFERNQRFLEKQIQSQLGFEINLISPVKLLQELQQDEQKDSQNALTLQPNDVTAGKGRDNES